MQNFLRQEKTDYIKMENLKEKALLYHSQGKAGKIEVVPTKPHKTQEDL